MSITVPYSLELNANQDAKDTVAGTTVAVVPDKIKIFLGAGVDVSRLQSITGSLWACFRKAKAEALRASLTADVVVSGNYLRASAGNIVIAATTAGVTANDVVIVVSSSYGASGGSDLDESFAQLVNYMREDAMGNVV